MFKNPFGLFFILSTIKKDFEKFESKGHKKGLPSDRPFVKYFITLLFYFGDFYHVGRQVQVHRCTARTYGNIALF